MTKGRKHTPETRKKMSLAKQNVSEKTRDKISKALTGSKRSLETRNKMSISKRKITDAQVHRILFLRDKGFTQKAISKIYGVSQKTICVYLKKSLEP